MTTLAATEFATFGPSHLAMLGVFVVGLWPVASLGRLVRGTDHAPLASRAFALVIPTFTIPLQLIDLLPGRFSFHTSLPLQLCDLAWVAATVALWTGHRYAVALTYFWGLSLTSQALVTPNLSSEFPDPKFLGFWGMHLLIVWAAVFLVWGLGHSPRWSDYVATVATTLGWLACVFAFNLATGTNYGFVNAKPRGGSVLDHLGPWPAYVFVEITIVGVTWALMTWPWNRRPALPQMTARL